MPDTLKTYYFKRQRRNMWIGVTLTALIISCIFLSYFTFAEKPPDTLALVHMVFRHGDRTPTESYANDPYRNYDWPDGWGALTNKGKLQMFDLGKTLRTRYKTFIGDKFSPSDVYVQSSDSDRCHMTAATLLAGMFPPAADHVWNSDLSWQPIPIHSLPRNLDNLIAMKKACFTYDEALKEAYNSDEIRKINEENKELYALLTDGAGQDVSNITALEFLFNTLEIEEQNGLTLPPWTKQVYPGKMKHLAARSLAIFTETPFMAKMKGGVLLKEMINHIKKKRENILKPNRKIFMYSAHDISLVNFLRALDFTESMKPEYGATFVLEAHNTKLNDYEIKMLYYNSSWTTEPHILKMDACGSPCTFENFVKVIENAIPENWEKECQRI